MNKIDPKILKGTRDFLPRDMAARELVMKKIRKIFERFGYDSIETPIICPGETILGKYGEEGDKLTYNFEDNGGRQIALPYDLTVPFARLVAANWQTLPMPFKRYQIQRVWRAEKPQKGRLREFYQCDIDIIGTRSLICEAEIAKIITVVFSELGFENFVIKLNSRRLLNSILASFKVEDCPSTIRIIDKLGKIGEKGVVEMLLENGLKDAKKIIKLIRPEGNNAKTFEKLKDFDTSELQEFFDNCKELGVPEKSLQFDPSLARGLDYYTGISFEVYCGGIDLGALCAGGRYDDLCSMFCNKEFSGVGVAFGFERIMIALNEMGSLKDTRPNSRVLITYFEEELKSDCLKIYEDLTKEMINSEVYFEAAKLSKQFAYADKKGIPFVVIRGPEEKQNETVTVKIMKTGKQKNIPRNQLTSYLKSYYEN